MNRQHFASLTMAAAIVPSPSKASPLMAIERASEGRLGVAVLEANQRRVVGLNADERFAFCSTFKAVLVAAVLARVDRRAESLHRRIAYGATDLLPYAPVTRAHVRSGGLSVEALCAAAIEYSDNTAANLLYATVGGPPGLTSFVRRADDATTRFDRTEPALNSAAPGDPRDTSTPLAMAGLLARLLLGDTLTPGSRARLEGWMEGCTTGNARLRAGLPAAWRVGDKTGTGDRGATNDVAIARPPGRAPLVIVAYSVGSPQPQARREATLAAVGRAVANLGSPRGLRASWNG